MNLKFPIILLLSLFLFASGCVGLIEKTMGDYVNDEFSKTKPQTINYYKDLEACVQTNCNCFICQTKDKPTDSLSLKEGSCYIDKSCTFTRYQELIKNNGLGGKETIRQFMIGQGTGFADFSVGNAYCANGLDMAVKWVTIKNDQAYFSSRYPKTERAACFLENGVIPVYVLSAEGTTLTGQQAASIAKKFNGLGPVIITTQINFDITQAGDIKDQIKQMKSACSNCLIAVAPKMGDQKALDEILSDKTVLSKTNLIAFGLDSRFSKSQCQPEWLTKEGTDFAQYGLVTYKIPSIWVYMMIERGGKNADGTCTWDKTTQPKLHNYFFKTEISEVIQNGVVGAAPYSLYGIDNPLGCADCALVNFPDDPTNPLNKDKKVDTIIKQDSNEPALSHWYAFCKAYSSASLLSQTGKMFSVFPSQTENSLGCTFAENNLASFFNYGDGSEFAEKTKDPSNPKEFGNLIPVSPEFTCDFCAAGSDLANAPSSVAQLKPGYILPCDAHKSIDIYADKWDVDPLLLRAVIDRESRFEACAASIVANSKATYDKLVSDNKIINGYYMGDPHLPVTKPPDGVGCYNPKLANVPDPLKPHDTTCYKPDLTGTGLSYCAFGLGQSLVLPFSKANEPGFTYPSSYMPMETAKSVCFENFNPYNSTHAACLSAYQLRGFWEIAESIVDSPLYKTQLKVENDPDLAGWYKAYLAVYMYGKGSSPTIQNEIKKWITDYGNSGGTCTIYIPTHIEYTDGTTEDKIAEVPFTAKDFIDFANTCKSKTSVFEVMEKYRYLINNCKGIGCPYNKFKASP